MADIQQEICWKVSIPIFKNIIILKQLGMAIGIPFGFVALIIMLISGGSRDAMYALGLISVLLLLTWLLIMAMYRGNYEAEFVLDQKGARCKTQARQAKKNRVINTLAVVFGIFSGKPAVAGAGLLAQSRQEVFLRWNDVTKVKWHPQSRTILLRGGWMEQISLFCAQDNYEQIENFVLQKTHWTDGVSRK